MKKVFFYGLAISFAILLFGFYACNKTEGNVNPEENVNPNLLKIKGLSLYWHHTTSYEKGRHLLFDFYGSEAFENSYQLVFEYKINDAGITVLLVDMIDEGKCPKYPGDWDTLCIPRGTIIIPEKELPKNDCDFILKTPNFTVTSQLVFEQDKITLEIPENTYFSNSIKSIYPIPVNILYGDVVYYSSQSAQAALDFFANLEQLNLIKTTLPNYPYRHLMVDGNGNPLNSDWPPDSHSRGLLYEMNDDFSKIVKIATSHFNSSNIDVIGLFSSNGDEAHFNKIDGIHVVYAK